MAPLEKYMIEQGAPTLASLKTGTLFCVDTVETGELLRQVGRWDRNLADKGISITLLRYNGHRALVYMYRRTQLQRDLMAVGAAELLKQCGYVSIEPEHAISKLRERFCEGGEFPHEIGLFLGRSAMFWAISRIGAGTASSPDGGRCMAMNRALPVSSSASAGVVISTQGSGVRVKRCSRLLYAPEQN